MFDLKLGPVALAFCGAGSPEDHTAIDSVIENVPKGDFASQWLAHSGLGWAADLITQQFPDAEEYVPWLDAAE